MSTETTTPLLTPAEWAEKLGFIAPANPNMPQQERHAKWQHAAADTLHGWSEHAFHFQSPEHRFAISEDTYRKALSAAANFPVEPPHEAALPESQRPRFASFKRAAKSGDDGKTAAAGEPKAEKTTAPKGVRTPGKENS